MINRAALILKYKEPAVKWINDADPDGNPNITLEQVNNERTVYLIRDEDADAPDILKQWIKLNYKTLFESELEGWYVDESLWPQKRTLALFNKWFNYECHTVLVDKVDAPIVDDDDFDNYH